MCGIAGIVTRDGAPRAESLSAMLGALAHRGPDGGGLAVVGGAAFGHRRLAIHDLTAAGCQPFVDAENGLVAVVNGEFYDAPALRDGLLRRGHAFRGRSDSEIVLPLWREKGEALVESLHGPFAIAIADADGRRLFLARDRVGKKPLFWTQRGDEVLFSSELGGLRAIAAGTTLRQEAVLEVLRAGYVGAPATPYAGIHAVPPGSSVTFENGAITTKTWWTPPLDADPAIDDAAATDVVARQLRDAVARRLASERPLGVLLSGGLDSSAVLLLANEAAGAPLPAYTLGFADAGGHDEAPFARAVASALGSPHEVFPFDGDPAAIVRDVTERTGEVLADPSLIAWAHLCRRASERGVVFLTGDGGDEALIGYRRHRAARLAGRVPPMLRALFRGAAAAPFGRSFNRALSAIGGDPRAVLADLAGLTPWSTLAPFLDPDARSGGDPLARAYSAIPRAEDAAADAARLDLLTYLPGDLMPKADRGAMSFGIETRSPFLDDAFLEAALRIRGSVRATLRAGKRPLRAMLAGRLPDAILRRGKRGFAVPLSKWLRSGPLATLARELLHDVATPFHGVLEGGSARRIFAAFERGAEIEPLVYACVVLALAAQRLRRGS